MPKAVFTYGKLQQTLAIPYVRVAAELTGNDVTRIHCILVLDEAETVHELDLSDLAGAMGLEVALDFCLGGIAGKVAQVKAGRGYLGHGCSWYVALSC